VPGQERFRRNDCRDLSQQLEAKFFGLRRKATALVVIKSQPMFTDLFTKNTVFFH
jgi:hypothetical protein